MTCADTKKYLEEFLPLIEEIPNDRKIVIAPPVSYTHLTLPTNREV